MLLGVVCVEESDGSTIIFVPLGVRIWAVQGRKRCNCMCSGSARMWEQLCSPGESNSDHEVHNMVSVRRLTPSVCVVEHLSGILIGSPR